MKREATINHASANDEEGRAAAADAPTNGARCDLPEDGSPSAPDYSRLHICRKLTNNGDFCPFGNGGSSTFGGKLVLWYSSPRTNARPGAGVKKSEAGGYSQQNAVDCLLAMANIAERVAPYRHLMKELGRGGEEELYEAARAEALNVALKESGAFVERFGVPHMLRSGEVAPFEHGTLAFDEDYGRVHGVEANRPSRTFTEGGSPALREIEVASLERSGLHSLGQLLNEAEERMFLNGVLPYAKDFGQFGGLGRQRERLRGDLTVLEEERREKEGRLAAKGAGGAEHRELEAWFGEEYLKIHADKDVLVKACKDAAADFTEEQRSSLSSRQEGYLVLDAWRLELISTMFDDALLLYAALHPRGEHDELAEHAFRRILTRCHMEIFDVDIAPEGRSCKEASRIADSAKGIYTIWFESGGRDCDNPGSEMDLPSYELSLAGVPIRLTRKNVDRYFGLGGVFASENRFFDGGRCVYKLCDEGETADEFSSLVRSSMQFFLDGIIAEGLSLNYKGRFSEAAEVDPKKPLVMVNDRGSDLVATLWKVMDLINRGEISLVVGRCENCGKLIDVGRSAGVPRKYCDDSCRSLHSKRTARAQEGGKSKDVAVREEFLRYVDSGKGIRLGFEPNMGDDVRTPYSDKGGGLKAFLSRVTR